MKICDLFNKEFKMSVLRKLGEVKENTQRQINEIKKMIQEQKEEFSREIEIIKKNQIEILEPNNIINKMKKLNYSLHSPLSPISDFFFPTVCWNYSARLMAFTKSPLSIDNCQNWSSNGGGGKRW